MKYKEVLCIFCDGTGITHDIDTIKEEARISVDSLCSECNGTGKITILDVIKEK